MSKVWVAWSYEEWGHGVRAAALSKEALVEELKKLFAFAEPVSWGPLVYERAPNGLDYSITMSVLPAEFRPGGPNALRLYRDGDGTLVTDDEFDVMSKEVESILTSWKPHFGIENWALTINFHRGPIPGNEDAAGVCHSLWEYMEATLEFNVAELAEMDDHTREGVVIHELLHIIVDELKTKKGSPERVVTHLERILQRVKAAWDIEHGPKERNHCDRVEGVHRVLPQVRVGDGKQTHL